MKVSEPVPMLFIAAVVALAALSVAAAELMTYHWDQIAREGRLTSGKVIEGASASGQAALQLVCTNPAGVRLPLLAISNPPVTKAFYALAGQVRYETVDGTGFLEMWSRFPGLGDYFSRTLAARGPLACLQGSSDWRPFVLPFNRGNTPKPPAVLQFNLVLPGRGRVWISEVRLLEADSFAPLFGAWWDGRTGGVIGGAAGSIVGILGAAIGVLVARARARRLVFGIVHTLLAAGVALLGVGLVALVRGQPYVVYYPLLLVGGICVLVIAVTYPAIRKRYQQYELQRMQSLDTP